MRIFIDYATMGLLKLYVECESTLMTEALDCGLS